MFRRTLLILIGTTVFSTAQAGNNTPGLDQREANQTQRIEQGVDSGQLNEREAARLNHAEDRLQANEAKAKADGKVTARERRRLHREAQVNSARIAKQKHDRQRIHTR